MLNIEYTAEELAKIDEVERAQALAEERRNKEAAAAYKKALAEVGWDKRKLIVHTMPEGFGGATIHKVPIPEMLAVTDRRITKALTSDGKKDDIGAAVANLIENPSILVHPPQGELKEWQEEIPALYGQIRQVMDARVEHGNYVGKSRTSNGKRAAPPKGSGG